MDIQRHERIARIKQISGYLYVCLTWVRYALWVVWPLMVVVFLVGGKMQLTVGVVQMQDVELTLVQRLLMVALLSVFLWLALKITHHSRELIRHFSVGDIFNKQAIDHARKALHHGMVIYGVYLVSLLGSWFYSAMQTSPVHIVVNTDFIVALMFFGVMYVLLWALEIGCDLNEESELTI